MKINDYNRLVNLHANSLLGLVQLKPEQELTDGQRSNARIMEDMSVRATIYEDMFSPTLFFRMAYYGVE